MQAIGNQESFTVPNNYYRNELLSILRLKYDDYDEIVNNEKVGVGVVIKAGENIKIKLIKL